MPPGRNAPCHCGSGLKYKRCHEPQDQAAARAPHLQLLRNAPEPARQRLQPPPAAALQGTWEVDVAPMPSTFDDDPAARPVVVMLGAGGFVLSADVENRPSEEPEALAALMARDVLAAAQHSGVTPSRLAIRHPILLEPLQTHLTGHKIIVQLEPELPELDTALRSLLGHLFHGIVSRGMMRSQPETWAGWGMPAEMVAHMFEAAASYHRAAPWNIAVDERPIGVSRAGGPEWSFVVLGAAGQQTGLTCYEKAEDLELLYDAEDDDPSEALGNLDGMVMSLLFNTRSEIPKRMRDEIKSGRLEVAAPDAHPTLLVLNTPGGGIRAEQFALLRDALVSVPRFVEAFPEAFDEGTIGNEETVWTDPDTGLTCRISAFNTAAFDLMSQLMVLTPSGPTGAGATPGAIVHPDHAADMVANVVERFRAWMQDPEAARPLGDATAAKHADNALLFAEYCVHSGGRAINAVTEFDLRTFLYDWYPSQVLDSERRAREVPVSLRRFFMFLRVREAVDCPWAGPMLLDPELFLERWRSRPHASSGERFSDWRAIETVELMMRLLLPDSELDDGFVFGDVMGPEETRLYGELHTRWLVWRDEIIHAGVVAPSQVFALLRQRQQQWATTPSGDAPALTPLSAIELERSAMRERQRRATRGLGGRKKR